MITSLLKHSALRALKKLTRALLVACLLIGALPVQPVYALSYDDSYSGLYPMTGNPTSFTTGTPDTGLTYTCDNCTFYIWNAYVYYFLSAENTTANAGTITITSNDGKAFELNVINGIYSNGDIISGTGPEAFSYTTPDMQMENWSPGEKLVNEVVITNYGANFSFQGIWVDLDIPVPEVQGNGVTIVNGDASPSTEDGTHLGSLIGTSVDQTYSIRSIGDAALDLTGSPYVSLAGSPDISVTSQPTTDPIASGGSTDFTVRCTPTDDSYRTTTVSIPNASGANPYTFTVGCTGLYDIEIDLQRPTGISIADEGTDTLGPLQPGTHTLTYTVANTGTYELTVSSPTFSNAVNVSGTSVFADLTSPVPDGSTTAFTVEFDVDGDGAFGFDIDLANDDWDENPYTIHISGTGDSGAPGISAFERQTPASEYTNADTLVFRASFDEDVTNVSTTDFDVSGSTASVTGVSSVSADTYDLTVSGGDLASFEGTVGLDLAGTQYITDMAGNALPAGEPAADETYTLENTAPVLASITRQNPSSEYTNADSLVFRVTFDEDVTNVNAADFDVSGSTASITGVAMVSADVYDLTVSGGDLASFNGTVGIDLAGGLDITDLSGNSLPTDEPATDETYTVDNSAPSITSFTRQTPSSEYTNADTLVFRITFDEDVTNVNAADFDVSGSTANITDVAVESADVYLLTVSGGDLASLNGTVGVNLAGTQDITDLAGSALPAGEPATDETYTVDNISPTSVIDQAAGQADPATSLPIEFSVVFNEDVTGFTSSDLVFGGTAAGTPSGTVTGGPQAFTVSVSGLTGDGTITMSYNTGAASDLVGNSSTLPTLTDNEVTFNGDPLLEIQRPSGTARPDSSTDNIGSRAIGSNSLSYVLDNSAGTDVLSVSAVDLDNFTNVTDALVVTMSSTVPGGDVGTLDLSFEIPVDGPFSFDVEVTSNDSASPYNLTVSGTGTGGAPEIDIQRPALTSIPDGGLDALGLSDLGLINLTYTIDNSTGTSQLDVNTVTAANLINTSAFQVNTALPLTVAAGASGTLDIAFTTDTTGVFSLDMDLTTNDTSETTYDIAITGTAVLLAVTPAGLTSPTDGQTLFSGMSELVVGFNKPVQSGGGSGAADNPANYMLAEAGENEVFDTVSCSSGLAPDDMPVVIDSIVYDVPSMAATLQVNGEIPLPNGSYRLWVCGTTSVEDLSGNELNEGASDTTIDFLITNRTLLPETGFAPGRFTALPEQPEDSAYTAVDGMQLVLPGHDVQASILGVPRTVDGWDVSWLGDSAGYLYGSAYPTWEGNTVLTGHVWDADNTPGLFYGLKSLRYGDRFEIRSSGQVYTYEVRDNRLLGAGGIDQVFRHEEFDWVTLLTCEAYNPASGQYLYRRAVRAVLVDVR